MVVHRFSVTRLRLMLHLEGDSSAAVFGGPFWVAAISKGEPFW